MTSYKRDDFLLHIYGLLYQKYLQRFPTLTLSASRAKKVLTKHIDQQQGTSNFVSCK